MSYKEKDNKLININYGIRKGVCIIEENDSNEENENRFKILSIGISRNMKNIGSETYLSKSS